MLFRSFNVQDDKDVKKLIEEKKEVEEQAEEEVGGEGQDTGGEDITPEDVITGKGETDKNKDDLDLSFLDSDKAAAFDKAVKASLVRFNRKS